jgi:hypothetical protein
MTGGRMSERPSRGTIILDEVRLSAPASRDQLFGPVSRDLICDGPLYPAVALYRLFDFVALLTHGTFPDGRERQPAACRSIAAENIFSGFSDLHGFRLPVPLDSRARAIR